MYHQMQINLFTYGQPLIYTNCSFKFEPRHEKTSFFVYAKTKTQISFALTAKLISAFVFAIRIVQSLYFLNPKFQASSHLRWLWFVPDQVKNPENRFSYNEAHFMLYPSPSDYGTKMLGIDIRKACILFKNVYSV